MAGLLIEISLPDLCVDSIVQCVCLFALWVDRRSREMCLFVKQFEYNIFMSFLKDINIFKNVNSASWPLAPQSKEISANNNRHVYSDQHSAREVKKRWLGDHANLKGLKHGDGWLISSNTLCFVFIQNTLIFRTYIHLKTLISLFKSFHEFLRITHFFK